MCRSGGHNVYELLEDKVVWHILERDRTDLPKDSYPVIAEGWLFQGIARFGYYGWKDEEGGRPICEVKRWAMVPDEIWHSYYNNFFEPNNNRPKFQSEEEFLQFKDKAISVGLRELPDDAVVIGDFSKDYPYHSYEASIYYKDNQYYICEDSKSWQLD